MISEECTKVGNANRKRHDSGYFNYVPYPENCQCACLHREMDDWDAMYSVKLQPWQVRLNESKLF